MKIHKNKLLHMTAALLLLSGIVHASYISDVQEWTAEKAAQEMQKAAGDKTKITVPAPTDIPADIAYWIADIKYNEQGVKIVELGDGNFAGYKVLDNMHFRGKVWSQVWQHLLSLGIPVWYVGSYASDPDVVAWKRFRELGGFHSETLETLQRDTDFQEHAQRASVSPARTLKDYQGIIVLKRYNPSLTSFENFAARYPNFLILNETSSLHVSNKSMTDSLFDTPAIKEARPKAVIYPKRYTRGLAKDILSKLPADWLVIKPINSGRGNGIIMVDREHLSQALHKVLIENKSKYPPNNDYTFKPDTPMSYEYWKYDRNTRFLVEEFAESKPIIVDNKPYDPTMRVIFIMQYEQGQIKLDYIDAYWKKPVKSLLDEGTFKEKHISKHAPNFEESQGLGVSEEDLAGVKEAMAPVLPRLFWNILVDAYAQPAHTVEINDYQALRMPKEQAEMGE